MFNLESVIENETHKFLWDFKITNKSPTLGQMVRLSDIKKKVNMPNIERWQAGRPQSKNKK